MNDVKVNTWTQKHTKTESRRQGGVGARAEGGDSGEVHRNKHTKTGSRRHGYEGGAGGGEEAQTYKHTHEDSEQTQRRSRRSKRRGIHKHMNIHTKTE